MKVESSSWEMIAGRGSMSLDGYRRQAVWIRQSMTSTYLTCWFLSSFCTVGAPQILSCTPHTKSRSQIGHGWANKWVQPATHPLV